jgi:outer membrane immunogenic protein
MKKVLLGGVALITLGFVGSAVAADMPIKAPVVVSNTWTGFYLGGDIGGGYFKSDRAFGQTADLGLNPAGIVFDPVTFSNANWGGTGGVHAGYNWQLSPSWVVGAEVDWDLASVGNGTGQQFLTSGGVAIPPCIGAPPPGPGNCHGLLMSTDLHWTASARAKLGYVFGSAMFYATGGGAWANEGLSGQVAAANFFTSSITTSNNHNVSGWVAGGGVELMATANWLLRLEYLHYQFDSTTTTSVPCSQCVAGPLAGPGTFTWGKPTFDVIRAGLSYKFDQNLWHNLGW